MELLTETYVGALLANAQLADEVWEAWDKGEIDDELSFIAWLTIAENDVKR